MKKIVVPFSGGMDSTVLLYKALMNCAEVHALTFDYGQRHKKELECTTSIVAHLGAGGVKFRHKTIDVRYIRDIAPVSSLTNDGIETPDIKKIAGEAQPKSYVPFRNLMFLSIALSYAESIGASEVWHGATKVDSLAGYWDGSPEFLPQLNALCSLNRENRISIEAPLIGSVKSDIVRMGINLYVPFEKTYTCYSGLDIADASSPSSSLRLQGFIKAGYKDPQKYIQQDKIEEIYTKNGCKEIPYIRYA